MIRNNRFFILGFSVFVSGAAVMALEMLGSRLITPVVGATIDVWTALISVFLFSIAVGYSLGDLLADKRLSFRILASLFFAAALCISQISWLKGLLNGIFLETALSYWAVSLLYTALLLLLPAVLLGAITVYSIRLSVYKSSDIGRQNGILYAVSTIGSLAGIVGASFYLVPFYPVSTILFFLAGVLLFTGSILALHGWYVDKVFD